MYVCQSWLSKDACSPLVKFLGLSVSPCYRQSCVPIAVVASFAERELRNIWPSPRRLLRLDVGRSYDLGPLLFFIDDELAEVGWGPRKRRAALFKPCF